MRILLKILYKSVSVKFSLKIIFDIKFLSNTVDAYFPYFWFGL